MDEIRAKALTLALIHAKALTLALIRAKALLPKTRIWP